MSTALEATQFGDTAAAEEAAENFRANLSAMWSCQPELADRLRGRDGIAEWVFVYGRDGYLTARTNGGWWTGCSIPLRTARELLKKLELIGGLGCMLNPSHAAQVRACFEKIQPTQAILAVVPEMESLKILLHCDDFSAELGAARLLFAAGADWPGGLGAIFEKFPGLALPQQFIRTALLDDGEMARLSSEAQTVISRETARRSEKLSEILARGASRSANGRIVVLAGSRFNLADLSNLALRRALLDDIPGQFTSLDPDHPLTASSLALADAAAEADALVAADFFRADLPGVVSPRTAWITWVTNGRIVAPDAQCPADALLLADARWRQPAITAGWPAQRIQIAGWPEIVPASAAPSPPVLGLFSDIRTIEIPQRVKDFSSQLLLWEFIEDELSRDPLSLGDDPERYLQSRMARLNIREEGVDRAAFFENLIVPAYKRGLSCFLSRNGIPLALFGRGWEEIPELKSHACGPIESVPDLANAVWRCRAVLQPFPGQCGATGGLPVPVIQIGGLTANQFLREVRQTLNGKPRSGRLTFATLGREQILSVLGRLTGV
ncbi:MAG: hypothetical protein ABSC42_06760 [Tepidisphaeraceae bacterium]|jgi:hypothetical protein